MKTPKFLPGNTVYYLDYALRECFDVITSAHYYAGGDCWMYDVNYDGSKDHKFSLAEDTLYSSLEELLKAYGRN